MFIRKSCFGLPGQYSKFSKRAARRTCSLPPQVTSTEVPVHRASYEQAIKISETGNTMVDPGKSGAGNAVRARGTSPRVKVLQYRYDSSNVWQLEAGEVPTPESIHDHGCFGGFFECGCSSQNAQQGATAPKWVNLAVRWLMCFMRIPPAVY